MSQVRQIDITQAVTQWTSGIRPSWSLTDVRTALRCHALGDFSLSAQLVDSMGEDDMLAGVREKRVDAVLGSDFELEAVESPNKQLSERLKAKFDPIWWDMFPESELSSLLDWYRMLGVGLAILDWDKSAAIWKPRLRTLHPQFLWWEQSTQTWWYNAREGLFQVTPGDGRWVLLIDGTHGWMRCAMRALAITWMAKQFANRDWNRYNERHGLPIIKAYVPAFVDDDEKEDFFESAENINGEAVAKLPTHLTEGKDVGFDLDLLEARDNSWESFKELLDRCDRRFMVHMLGSNLSTEVTQQGARAASESHRGVERAKAQADSQKLSTELRRQAFYPAAAMNIPSVTLEVTPWPKWSTEPPEDIKFEAESIEALGLGLQAITKGGYNVENIDEVGEKYGLTLVKAPLPDPAVVATSPAPGAPSTNQDPNASARESEGETLDIDVEFHAAAE